MTTTTSEPHRHGALILRTIAARRLKRADVARAIGITPKVFWQFLQRRPVPIDRFNDLIKALQLTPREADAIKDAYIADISERRGRYKRSRPPAAVSEAARLPDHPATGSSYPF